MNQKFDDKSLDKEVLSYVIDVDNEQIDNYNVNERLKKWLKILRMNDIKKMKEVEKKMKC